MIHRAGIISFKLSGLVAFKVLYGPMICIVLKSYTTSDMTETTGLFLPLECTGYKRTGRLLHDGTSGDSGSRGSISYGVIYLGDLLLKFRMTSLLRKFISICVM